MKMGGGGEALNKVISSPHYKSNPITFQFEHHLITAYKQGCTQEQEAASMVTGSSVSW